MYHERHSVSQTPFYGSNWERLPPLSLQTTTVVPPNTTKKTCRSFYVCAIRQTLQRTPNTYKEENNKEAP